MGVRPGRALLLVALALGTAACSKGTEQVAGSDAAIQNCVERYANLDGPFADNPVWVAVTYDISDLGPEETRAFIDDLKKSNAETERVLLSKGSPVDDIDQSALFITGGKTFGRRVILGENSAEALRAACRTIPAGMAIHQIRMGVPDFVRP